MLINLHWFPHRVLMAPEDESAGGAAVADESADASTDDAGAEADDDSPFHEGEPDYLELDRETDQESDDESADDASDDAEQGAEPGTDEGAGPKGQDSQAAPAAPDLQPHHYQHGRSLGLNDEQMKTLGPEVMDRMLGTVATWLQDVRPAPQQGQPVQPQGQQQPPQQGQQQAPAGQQQPDPADFTFPDPDSIDVEHVAQFADHANNQFRSLRQTVQQQQQVIAQLQQAEGQRQNDANWQQFDATLDTLDESLFGRGRIESFDPQSDTAKNRHAMANELSRQVRGYAASGEQIPPMPQLVKRAYAVLFGDRETDSAVQRIASQANKRRASTTATPPKRSPSGKATGDAAAMQAASNWLSKHGDDAEDAIDDGEPII